MQTPVTSMLPTLSSVIFRSHDATDGAVPALQKAIYPLLSLHGQINASELDDGYLLDSLMNSDGNDDDEVDERFVCSLLPHSSCRQEESNNDSWTEVTSAIPVLDISVSISAAAAIHHTYEEPTDKLSLVASVSPIRVTTAVTTDVHYDPSRHCSYRKGKCKQPRTMKRNGSLHTLCAFHREKSCANQKAFDGKKRSVSETESAAENSEKSATESAKRHNSKKMKSQKGTSQLIKTESAKKKEKTRTRSKKAAARGKLAAKCTPKRQRQVQDPTPVFTRDIAKCAKPREAEALETSKEQPVEMDVEEMQDERDFFAEFTRVLDGRQLSKAKQLALTQFLRDVLL